MRKLLVVGLTVALILAAAALSLRRIPPGAAAWHPARGELRVGGERSLWLPRWGWRTVPSPSLTLVATGASREGARTEVAIVVNVPPGRTTLAPAATPLGGLESVLGVKVRELVAAQPLLCLAGLPGPACPVAPEQALTLAVTQRLGLPAHAVSVRVTPDAAAVAAAQRSLLQGMVGRPPRRVLLVGLDGGDWELLEPLARRGVMPNLARLMATGSWGELTSITPLLSPLIWTTMATGVGPEVHGILDFVEADPATGAKVPISGRQRRVPALWNMASAAGLSVVVSGWWATWPAETVNGVLISDRLFFLLSDTVAEGPMGTVVFPPEAEAANRALAERAERETDEATIRALLPVSDEAYRSARAAAKGMADPIDGFRRIVVGTRTYFGAALAAAAARPDLMMVYCIGTDEVGHVLAPYLPPPLPGADASFSQAAAVGVERYFAVVDRWIGRLHELCPPRECAVLVVSDHGFKWSNDRPRDFSGVAAATAALWHRPRGMYVLSGHGVAPLGRSGAPASVFDVAPTVSALLNLPPGQGWPGEPLPGAPAARADRVAWLRLAPPESYRPTVGPAPPSAEYVAQLKAIGYLEGSEGRGTASGGETEGELNNLGLIHLEAKRYDEAERAFLAAAERNRSYASPHYNLRRLYFETGRYDAADAELDRAVALGLRDSVGALDRAAADYEGIGLSERAATVLARATQRFPGEARLAVHHLAVLLGLSRCAEGSAVGATYAEAFRDDATVLAFAGLAAACAGDTERAKAALTRSLGLSPNQPEIAEALRTLTR